jgi:hypothetical protein
LLVICSCCAIVLPTAKLPATVARAAEPIPINPRRESPSLLLSFSITLPPAYIFALKRRIAKILRQRRSCISHTKEILKTLDFERQTSQERVDPSTLLSMNALAFSPACNASLARSPGFDSLSRGSHQETRAADAA